MARGEGMRIKVEREREFKGGEDSVDILWVWVQVSNTTKFEQNIIGLIIMGKRKYT